MTAPWANWGARRRLMRLFRENQQVVENQRPRRLPDDLTAELYVPSDALSVAYRRIRQQCLNLGWGIDNRVTSNLNREALGMNRCRGRIVQEASTT